ncbi:2-polyprenylphenol 6-hydroxylase [Herbivorax sp. ANBcel31]|uniref:2-polyprenylphenol 6-hydroxylase n=1 Tax=Herbivorax sp. ANBcel31 TaxID=3069754 RepID=UPI0027B4E11E|nr:2-polyprenylphenol 6-hydroxylase [Herbivorax sp. ANBcel31]MDQ2087320.1 2-polyprenylphenol 6-hydroxylase [Herbivorax sp. ANBcel31]
MINRKISITRYRQIIAVLTKHGFGLLLDQLGIFKYLKIKKKSSQKSIKSSQVKLSTGERLRLSLEELGPTFIKLGQLLSTRPDILPVDIVEELKKLQDSVPSISFDKVKKVIEEEFEDKLENVYKEFEEKPVAAASISQVHRAKLITEKEVAVKVQRPEIEKTINQDLNILKDLAGFLDNHTKYGKMYNFKEMVEEFENVIKSELDFTKEAENADTFKQNFTDDEDITVPSAKWIYTTKRVLTMEYIDGIRIDDYEKLDNEGLDRRKLAENLAISVSNQIFRDGFFHADPHPGNIRVLSDGKIVFLDLGMIGILSESRKRMISNFFIGVTSKNSRLVVKSIIDMGAMPNRNNLKKFERDVDIFIDKYLEMPLKEIKVDKVFYEIFNIAYSNKIRIPREFALLAKTFGTLQALLESLAPDLNPIVVAKPIAKKLFYQSFSLEKISKGIKRNLWNYKELLSEFPSAMLNFLTKMEDEDFAFQLEIKEIGKIQKRFERALNRMSFSVVLLSASIIIAGIIIGSSLSAAVGAGDETSFFNVIMLRVSLAIALVIVIVMVVSMFRSKN